MHAISAAHTTMPLPSYARVTNLDNGRSIIVRVNDRGPYVRNRIIDLSIGTAKALDFYGHGLAVSGSNMSVVRHSKAVMTPCCSRRYAKGPGAGAVEGDDRFR